MRSFLARTISAACAVLCLAALGAYASGPGTTAANFLKIPVGARGAALGGALTASVADADAVFYNPAGLGLGGAPELSYAYNNYFSGISQQWLAFSLPVPYGAWGLGLNYLAVKPFASYDAADNRTGDVSAYDAAAYLGYSRARKTGLPVFSSLRWGASLKYIRQKLDAQSASGYGADAGLILSGFRDLKLGFGAENLVSSRLSFDGAGARPARKFKAGASYDVRWLPVSALFSADLNFPEDGAAYVSAGVENTLYGLLNLRAGYSSFGEISNGLNFGLGLGLPRREWGELRFDYSFGATNDLGNVHKLAVTCRFAAVPAAAVPAVAVPAAAVPAAAVPDAPVEPPKKTPKEGFSALIEDLYGDDQEKAEAAAVALAALNHPGAIEHFSALLSSGKTGWKLAALRGLAASEDPKAPELLVGALRAQQQEVRLKAALAIAVRGGQPQLMPLEEALKREETEDVKGAIIEALVKIKAR